MLDISLRSRALWLEILNQARLPYRNTGSLHLAYREDEADVAREFAERGPGLGYECSWLTGAQVQEKSQAVQPDALIGGLWSSTEFTIDPRQIIQQLPVFLEQKFGVRFFFSTLVTRLQLLRIFCQSSMRSSRELSAAKCQPKWWDFTYLDFTYPRHSDNSK